MPFHFLFPTPSPILDPPLRRAEMPFGLTRLVHNLLATRVQSLLQKWISRPEGPATPLTCRATLCMQLAVIWLYTTGWTGGGSALPIIRSSGLAGVALECLERKISRADFKPWSPRSMLSSTCRTPLYYVGQVTEWRNWPCIGTCALRRNVQSFLPYPSWLTWLVLTKLSFPPTAAQQYLLSSN